MATKVHAAQQLFLITAVLTLCNWQQKQAQQVVFVNSTEQCQGDYQCNNFTYLLNTSTVLTSNTIFFLPDRHSITASLPVSNITNLVLRGPEVSPNKPPVAHIVIKGVAFYFVNLTLQYNALHFLNINTMVIDSVNIIVNYGYGLYAHNILGKFSIRNCKFLNNSAKTCNNDGGNTKITYDGFTDIKHNILQISHSAFGYSESSCNAQNGVLHIEVMSTVGIEQY